MSLRRLAITFACQNSTLLLFDGRLQRVQPCQKQPVPRFCHRGCLMIYVGSRKRRGRDHGRGSSYCATTVTFATAVFSTEPLCVTEIWKNHDADAAKTFRTLDGRSATTGIVQIKATHGAGPSTSGAVERFALPV